MGIYCGEVVGSYDMPLEFRSRRSRYLSLLSCLRHTLSTRTRSVLVYPNVIDWFSVVS